MTAHLSDEQMIALLHGSLSGDARAEAREHLGLCGDCAGALAKEAALDELLWQAHDGGLVRSAPSPVVRRRPARERRYWPVRAAVAAVLGAVLTYASFSTGTAGSARMELFAWQNVTFYISLIVGFLLVLGSVLGGHHEGNAGHEGPTHDGHPGVPDGSHRADATDFFGKALTALGVGRVPMTVLLMIASFLFGGAGLIASAVLSPLELAPALSGLLSVTAAALTTGLLGGGIARLISRVMPTSETYLVSRHQFAGCTGILLVPADASSGYAQIKDREGNVHNIKCRTTGASLAKGQEILVVEYDDDGKTCVVDANPIARTPLV
jgi:membrane protein implicated in regulation of membrane protease activity